MTLDHDPTSLRLGFFGLGCVGQGLHDVLERTPGLRAEVVRICVKDRAKERRVARELITFDPADILDDDRIDVVVELIDDHEAAFRYVTEAMRKGKSVITANKRMVALNLAELIALQREAGVSFLYEASVGGSIPILRNLEEYYDNDLLRGVEGIVNGTTNYILTRVHASVTAAGNGAAAEGGGAYGTALREAQRLGFAETDPTMDVEGWDATFKTTIIAVHAFGTVVRPEEVVRRGITAVDASDVQVARARGAVIKLLSRVVLDGDTFSAVVLPVFVPADDPLAGVDNEVNGIRVTGVFSDAQLLVGKGAGGYPTASAVLSDISAHRYGYQYEYRKLGLDASPALDNRREVTVYVRDEPARLDAIPWKDTLIDHREHERCYRIGTVDLLDLAASASFKEPKAFVALL